MELLQLFEYQTWADERLFQFLDPISEDEINRKFEDYTSIKQRMDHIVMALDVWYQRLQGNSPPTLPSFLEETSEEIISRWRELNTKLSLYFSVRRQQNMSYKNSSGQEFNNSLYEVAVHVMNHTTFYRSQIIMMIRMLGYPVQNTDYIYFLRST